MMSVSVVSVPMPDMRGVVQLDVLDDRYRGRDVLHDFHDMYRLHDLDDLRLVVVIVMVTIVTGHGHGGTEEDERQDGCLGKWCKVQIYAKPQCYIPNQEPL
ncbi:hypothetical protein JTE90_010910 [Oedothorax gibbosus]|uniref:Uncharacterized protein n=1 Tax=Oedothorax gibbosus TaxID=931172 RepID=A0AAV6UF34_9ARAC|nr:hypothetical protein JTE90_010910 [Oedothorax gibbosus]